MSKEYPILGSPIWVNGVKLKNRMITTSMSPGDGYVTEDGKPTTRLAAYLEERAKGQTALITQTIVPWKRGKLEAELPHKLHPLPSCYDDSCIPDLQEYMVEPVHRHGGLICAQLYCVHDWKPSEDLVESPYGPTDIAILKFMGGFKAMTVEQIEQFKAQYFSGVRVIKKAGFDAVEVMAGVGGMMNRFMARATNTRTDEYGGSLENRFRLTREIIEGTRKVVGPDFPIVVRWSPVDFIKGKGGPGLEMEESLQIAQWLEEAGCDLHDLAVGWHETSVPLTTKRIADCEWTWISEKIKTVAKKPVAQGYRNTDPTAMEKALQEGKVDVIAGLRYSIADPDLPRKVMEDRTCDMRKCIVCCRCLDDVVSQGKPLNYCGVNPRLGEELDHEELPPLMNGVKNVMVIGAGPAGINAAVYAAKRGHKVDLYEAGPRVGGSVKMSSIFTTYHERYLEYLKHMLKTCPEVKLHLNKPVDAELVKKVNPDVAIVAMGGEVRDLDVPGKDGKNVINSHMFLDMLNGDKPRAQGAFNNFMWFGATTVLRLHYTPSFARKATGALSWPISKDVAIIGGGLPGCEFGELCEQTDRKTAIIDDHKKIGFDVGGSDRIHMLKAFRESPKVDLYPMTTVSEITETGVKAVRKDKDGNEEEVFIPAKTVAITLGFQRNAGLYEAIKDVVPEVYIVGDANDPHRIADATKAGYRAACEI